MRRPSKFQLSRTSIRTASVSFALAGPSTHFMTTKAAGNCARRSGSNRWGDWGDGDLRLLEIPAASENNANIVAQWCPKTAWRRARASRSPIVSSGAGRRLPGPPLAVCTSSRAGRWRTRQRFRAVEMTGDVFADPQKAAAATADVQVDPGKVASFALPIRTGVRSASFSISNLDRSLFRA